MTNIRDHQSSKATKLLFIGDSGMGKTGALCSLCSEYKVRVIDVDNGLDIMKDYLTNKDSPYVKAKPNIADNLEFVTLTDPMKSLNGKLIPSRVTVWQKTMNLLSHWKGEDTIDLGPITTWGPDTVLVIDSLTMLSTAALNFHLQMNGALAATRTQNEGRRDIGVAQSLLKNFLELIYDSSIKCNVILTSHITNVTDNGGAPIPGENMQSTGYPSAIGRALSPLIPRYFNSVLLAKTTGMGSATKHKIYTKNLGNVATKTTAPLRVASEYPLESGLLDYFKAVQHT